MKIKLTDIILIIGIITLVRPSWSYAQMGSGLPDLRTEEVNNEHGENINDVLASLLQRHNITTLNELDCDQINEEEFEILGEAWMGVMHPDPEAHEGMDAMMGGEGSESLRQAHVSMGQRYLGCGGGFGMVGGMGMMGMGGMMSTIRGGSTNMMNWGGTGMMGIPLFTGFTRLLWLSTWILVVVLLVVMIRYFLKKTENKINS